MADRKADNLAATQLRLTNIPGTARVRVGNGPGMSLVLTGPESLTKDVTWQILGDTLHVDGPELGGAVSVMISSFGPGGSRSVISGGRGSIVVGASDVYMSGRGIRIGGAGVFSGGDQVIINTGGHHQKVIVDGRVIAPGDGESAEAGEVELTVHVPAGTPVQIADDAFGRYRVEGTGGTLDLKLEGAVQVDSGATDAARMSITGSARVGIASVQRALAVNISGSGRVDVPQGSVGQLRVAISGSGQMAYGGTAQDADLDVSGSGRIRVDTVTGMLRKDVSGSGSIDVRSQPARSADDFWR